MGELAQRRWPGGVLVDIAPWLREEAAQFTLSLVDDEDVSAIYEAGISFQRVLTRVDVLARAPGGQWDLIEVKRSTRVKPPFDTDVALQYWILKGAGFSVRKAGVLVLNRDYVYKGGEHDLQKLFRFEDLTADCIARLDEIGEKVAEQQKMLGRRHQPAVSMGEQCTTPYTCDYMDHCGQGLKKPANPVSLLPRLQSKRIDELQAQGIEAVEDIPADYALTETQERVRTCIVTGRPWVSPGLGADLEPMNWPLYFLDFEAVSIDVPRYAGMRPFDQLPFQFSCHIQEAPGASLEHREFLAEGPEDPRRPLAESLLEVLGQAGSIVVYSGYERRTIRALADWLPELSGELLPLCDRLFDLLKVMQANYCHPGFGGSYSIKQVLPVMAPEMSYSNMSIADGQAAGWGWLEMLSAEKAEEKVAQRDALLAYCRQDSLAMVKVLECLMALAAEGGES